jgi:hypothetical protein
MMILRALMCAAVFWTVKEFFKEQAMPTFANAAYHVFYHFARFKMPVFFALLYQVQIFVLLGRSSLTRRNVLSGTEICT